jgi:hypothetical protein
MDTLLRTIITPIKQTITLELPEGFLGKRIEILAFPLKETNVEYHNQNDPLLTHFASEPVLAKDWLTPEDDKAWSSL